MVNAFEYMPRQTLNRHWGWTAIWYASGIAISGYAAFPGLFWVPVCAGVGCFFLFAPITLPRRSHWALAFLCIAAGGAVHALRQPPVTGDGLHHFALTYPRHALVFEGIARDTSLILEDTTYASFVLRVEAVWDGAQRHPLGGQAMVRWNAPDGPVFHGARVHVDGALSPHMGPVNHGVRGMEDVYRRRGVYSTITVRTEGVKVLREPRFSPQYWASRLRHWQAVRFEQVIPAPAYPFILGVWLGERARITQEVYEKFVYAGTAHVLAVSGVHVAIIGFSLLSLTQMLRIPGRVRTLLVMAGIITFAFMTGARPATLRAATMFLIFLSADALGRESDVLSSLGLSGCIFLTWQPTLLFETGFLLSYASVASILLFQEGFTRLLSALPRFLRGPLAVTLSAQLMSIPIAAWHFNILPITGILANLVVTFLLSASLWLCMDVVALAALAPPLALLPGHALLPIVAAIEWTNILATRLPAAYSHVMRPTMLTLALYFTGVALLHTWLHDERNRRKRLFAICAVFAVMLAAWTFPGRDAVIDFIDVGRGDATFVRTPGGTTLLIDGGDSSEYADAGARTVAPFLYANRVRRLDYVVVSHAHRDHIGGLFHILNRFPVGTVVLGPERDDPPALEANLLERCAAKGIPVLRLRAGDTLPARSATIEALHPPAAYASSASENNRSLALRVAWPSFSALLAGDIEEEAEAVMVETTLPDADILKIPHHGSPTSSTPTFLDAVAPRIAIASMSAGGRRSTLMTPVMVDRYESRGIELRRTDWHGGIRIQNGHALAAREQRGYTLRPLALADSTVTLP